MFLIKRRSSAFGYLGALALLHGFLLLSSVTSTLGELSPNDKGTVASKLSELVSSFNSDSRSTVSSFALDKPKIHLTSEEFSSILNHWQQGLEPNGSYTAAPGGNHHGRTGRHKGKKNRRKVLFDLSVQSHYERCLKSFMDRTNVVPIGNLGGASIGQESNRTAAFSEFDDSPAGQNDPSMIPGSQSCVYYNSGMDSPFLRKNKLNNDRIIFSHLTFWTYKLCRRQSIVQLHLNPSKFKDGDPDEKDIKGYFDSRVLELPQHSDFYNEVYLLVQASHDLGSYLSPATRNFESIVKSIWGSSEKITLTSADQVEYYIDGDSCMVVEESNSKFPAVTKRQSKVVYDYECCSYEDGVSDRIFPRGNEFRILSTVEPAPCRYVIRACRFCTANRGGSNETILSAGGVQNEEYSFDLPELSHLMKSLLQYQPFGTDNENSNIGFSNQPTGVFPPMPPSQIEANKQLLQSMFSHGYDSYMYNAFPASELHPVSCRPGDFHLVRIPALTLIDSLDTLIIMGNYTEFARGVERLRFLDEQMRRQFLSTQGPLGQRSRKGESGGLFSVNQNVSVFETTIRVLGGLISGHQLAVAFMSNVVLNSDVWNSSGDILLGNTTLSRDHVDQHESEVDVSEKILSGNNIETSSQSSGPPPCPKGSTRPESFSGDNFGESAPEIKGTNKQKEKENSTTSLLPKNGTSSFWNYDGILLTLAIDIGKRLLHAFDTETGIPYGTVNLLYGIPPSETTVASLAGAGTLTLEFELLSRLTGDDSFGKAAKLATRALWIRRSADLNLFGKHIDVKSGKWTEYLSGIGSNSDSFYEYLIKHYVLFPDDFDFWTMFISVYAGVWENSRVGDWYVDVDMGHGLNGHVRQIFESLMAFYPGMQVLLGELAPSANTLNGFFSVREFLGLLPERFNFVRWKIESGGDVHPLRPELLESCYFLHLATFGLHGSNSGACSNLARHHTSSWLWAADFALHAVFKYSWTRCGFSSVKKISPTTTGSLGEDFIKSNNDPIVDQKRRNIKHHDEMPSYFLSETLKYLYLTFDAEKNVLHQDSERDWIFTTEAHPIHYVPRSNPERKHNSSFPTALAKDSSEKEHLRIQVKKVRSLLKGKLSKTPKYQGKSATTSKVQVSENEQWSKKTSEAIFSDDLKGVFQDILQSKNMVRNAGSTSIGPPLHKTAFPTNGHGMFSLEVAATNYANQRYSHQGKGSGKKLGKRCPNFHHPDLVWTQALNGNALDYTSAHLSSTQDDFDSKDIDARMLTALASVCFFGTDYFAEGVAVDESNSCPVELSDFEFDKTIAELHQSDQPIPGASRYDMGNPLGQFDVSSFPNGEGFVVKHVDSGEFLEVSIFYNNLNLADSELDFKDTIVLVVLTTPEDVGSSEPRIPENDAKENTVTSLSTWRSSGTSWKYLFRGNVASPPNGDAFDGFEKQISQKYVVVGDLIDHAYLCKVTLTLKSGEINEPNVEHFLADYPCSPAMFGKADIPSLIKYGGASVSGHLNPPLVDDEQGCKAPGGDISFTDGSVCEILESNVMNESSRVQLVRRGKCNFMQKTINQYLQHNADAVIVINNEPNELFVMAGEKLTNGGCGMDVPLSVLISKNDGESMLKLIDKAKSQGADVDATVQLLDQESDHGRFPIVKGTKDALQVFASKGWGTHAVRQDNQNGWQLFIMQHSK